MQVKEIGCGAQEPESMDAGRGAGNQESVNQSGFFEGKKINTVKKN
jgi:hypothetical protein